MAAHAAAANNIIQQLGGGEGANNNIPNLQNITDLMWRIMKLAELIKPPLTGAEKKQLTQDVLLQLTDRFVDDHAMQALLRTYITQTLPKQIDILVAVANNEEVLAAITSTATSCGCGGGNGSSSTSSSSGSCVLL